MSKENVKAPWLYRKVLRHPLLGAFLEERGVDGREIQVGWGLKPSGCSARARAAGNASGLLLLEDAFVRSTRVGRAATC